MKTNPLGLVAGVAVLLIVIAGGYWLLQRPAPQAAPVATSTYPTTLPEATSSTPTTSVPGTPIVTQTLWRSIDAQAWKILLSVQTHWKVGAISSSDKVLSQLSIGGDTANYFVSRNIPIAEPSKLTYKTTTRKIAGDTVSIHNFVNPNGEYVAYEYFSIAAGGDTYYFQIQERPGFTKEVNDFLSLVEIK